MSISEVLPERALYTVSELTAAIKGALETQFNNIWVAGEISNFRAPASGHYYLTLKDDSAQLRAVCFRSTNRLFKFRPQDGLAVVVRGRITVYEPRGDYQLLVDFMEPQGLGSLQLAFEQLKARLQQEGLFDPARKRKLPLLPRRVGVITSPTGAVIRDILRILKRRNRRLDVLIYPVRVQGEGAAEEIAAGVRHMSGREDVDVVIVGRGGGSIEDLWAFNEEIVARAIFESRIPVISAVGHETDFTVADFVADLRAPTPSAAAELVSGARSELQERLQMNLIRLSQAAHYLLIARRQRLERLTQSRSFGQLEGRIRVAQQRIDEMGYRAAAALRSLLAQWRMQRVQLDRRLETCSPLHIMKARRSQLEMDQARLRHAVEKCLESVASRLAEAAARLEALSPLAILARGYSICQDNQGAIITQASQVQPRDALRVRLWRGRLECEVRSIESGDIPEK